MTLCCSSLSSPFGQSRGYQSLSPFMACRCAACHDDRLQCHRSAEIVSEKHLSTLRIKFLQIQTPGSVPSQPMMVPTSVTCWGDAWGRGATGLVMAACWLRPGCMLLPINLQTSPEGRPKVVDSLPSLPEAVIWLWVCYALCRVSDTAGPASPKPPSGMAPAPCPHSLGAMAQLRSVCLVHLSGRWGADPWTVCCQSPSSLCGSFWPCQEMLST